LRRDPFDKFHRLTTVLNVLRPAKDELHKGPRRF
jgi:hypothetical protein